jgi:TatD DNase family protein
MREQRIAAITVGTNGKSSIDAIALAEHEPDIFATVGFHPSKISGGDDEYEKLDVEPYSIERLKAIATSSRRVVAIGEAGIDDTYIRDTDPNVAESEKAQQRSLFRDHIRIASELDLPLIIHTRGAFQEIAEILDDEFASGHRCRAVIHCFTGNWDDASMLLDLGLMLSFTGIVTFRPRKADDPSKSTLRVIEKIPLDRMMVETDAPWLAPEPHRGERNEPAFVQDTALFIARMRGEDLKKIEDQTTENAIGFFRLKP